MQARSTEQRRGSAAAGRSTRRSGSWFRYGLLALVGGLHAASCIAATLVVTNLADTGPGTLRQRVQQADANDRIIFGVRGRIDLTNGAISLEKHVAIDGPGATNLTVSGAKKSRIFTVSSNVEVSLRGLTLSGGVEGNGNGGAIANQGGSLQVFECALDANRAIRGGGIWNNGTLSVTNSTLSRNEAQHGAALFNMTNAVATLANSTVSMNTNRSLTQGGAIENDGMLTLHRSTVTENVSSRNDNGQDGAGVMNTQDDGLRSQNTIIADNLLSDGQQGGDLLGPLLSEGFNIILSTNFVAAPGDITNLNNGGIELRALGYWGGPTETHALDYYSIAIDAGDNTGGPAVDQRGVRRVIDGDLDGKARSDIGAFEWRPFQIIGPTDPTTTEDNGTVSTPFTLALGDFDSSKNPITMGASTTSTDLVPEEGGLRILGPLPVDEVGKTNFVLQITPAPNAFGSAKIQLEAYFEGADAPLDSRAVTLTVLEVNDPPTLIPIPDLVVLEDSGASVVFLSGISAGDDESQDITVTAVSSAPDLMPNPEVIYTSPEAKAALVLQPSREAFGTSLIQVIVRDSGGSANGGIDAVTNVFQVVIQPVNDPPSFTLPSSVVAFAGSGPQVIPGWARDLSPGPANEIGQVLKFDVPANTQPSLFKVPPVVAADGTLTFTPADSAHGTNDIEVVLRDSGGMADGGSDTVRRTSQIILREFPGVRPGSTFSNLTVIEGSTVHWTVDASGDEPLGYRWWFEGEPLGGETNQVLNLTNVRRAREGRYQVTVTNEFGGVTVDAALTVLAATNSPRVSGASVMVRAQEGPPRELSGPASVDFDGGEEISMSVRAEGSEQLFVQWRLNGINLQDRRVSSNVIPFRGTLIGVRTNTPGQSQQAGEISSTLILSKAQPADAGRYSVVVENGRGALETNLFELRFVRAGDPGTGGALLTDRLADAGMIAGPVAGHGLLTGSNLGYAEEPGEPVHPQRTPTGSIAGPPTIASAWVNWTAPSSGLATFTTAGSAFDTLLAVYTNQVSETVPASSPSTLGRLVFDDDRGGFGNSLVRFTANQGNIYSIYVDGYAGGRGNVVLSWNLETDATPIPSIIDNPTNRMAAAGSAERVVFRVNASNQLYSDPNLNCDEASDEPLSVEWRFERSPDEPPVEHLIGTAGDGSLDVPAEVGNAGYYTAIVRNGCDGVVESTPALLEVVIADSTAAGTPKLTAITGSEDNYQNLVREPSTRAAALASRDQVAPHVGASVAAGIITSNLRAKRQPTDPEHCAVIGGASRWFLLRVPIGAGGTAGLFELNTMGSSVDTLLAVYVLDESGHLQLIACDDNSAPDGSDDALVRFVAESGTDYLVAVDARDGEQGLIELHCSQNPVPLNDSLLWVLIPERADATLDINGDGKIDRDGIVSVTVSPEVKRLFYSYTGADYPNLREIATENPQHCSGHLTNLVFNVNAGQRYLLAVLAESPLVEKAHPGVRFYPPEFTSTRDGNVVTLSWEGPYRLQATPTLDLPVAGVTPPWTDVFAGGFGMNSFTTNCVERQCYFRLFRGERTVLGYLDSECTQ